MKVGIVGYGNMGSAFAKAVSKAVGREKVIVYEVNKERIKEALEEGFAVARDLYFLVKESEIVVLAVKPKDLKGVLGEIKDLLGERVLISIAAGVDIRSIEEVVGKGKKIVRLMPNINVLVGKGAVAVVQNGNLREEELSKVLQVFSHCGSFYEIPETLFDSFTALAGSGPAFVFSFIDALALAGVKEGFGYEEALKIAVDTVLGSAKLLGELGGNPNEWVTRVASPGGTTVEGISYLERKGFKGTVIRCVEKTSEKARRLRG